MREYEIVTYKSPLRENGEYPIKAYKGMMMKDWRSGEYITDINSPSGPWAGFFSSDPAVANRFADAYATLGNSTNPHEAAVYPAWLKMNHPYVIDAKGRPASAFQFDNIDKSDRNQELLTIFNNPKYDGVIIKNTKEEGDIYVPKSSSQIRSWFEK